MPANYAAFDYGWVTTSHKSQGRTAENVVVAAESLDRKAFYVALSRGRKQMALHCPDKELLKQCLSFRHGERTSIHDLIRDREIPPNSILPLPESVRQKKIELLPDVSYKDIAVRAKKLLRRITASVFDLKKREPEILRIRKRRELKSKILNGFYRKHGYAPGAENGDMSLLDRHRAFERKRMAEAEYAEYEESLKPKLKIIPVTDEQRIELDEFIEAGYMKSYPKDLSKDQADKMIEDLWVREREVRRQRQLENERRQREQRAQEQRAREQRAREAKNRSRGMDL